MNINNEQEWIFYNRAAWNIDQAYYVANLLLKTDNKNLCHEQNVIRDAAYDFCLVSYCSPFLQFKITEKKRIKGLNLEQFVPNELSDIHEQIFTYRDKELAHTDISHLSSPGFDEGDRFILSRTHTSKPCLIKAYELFDAVRSPVINKFKELS